jgi:prepilin-type N-terminal cleavage/methylation domain-containing protein
VTVRQRRHRAHAGEQGLTLIELLVTIAIMGVGFLSLLSAFAVVERQVGSTSDNAQLASAARQVGDVMESDTFAYVQCTGPAGQPPSGNSYQTTIRGLVTIAGDTITVLSVAQAQAAGSSHTVSGNTTALNAISSCGSAGTGSGADYGVQRINFKVQSTTGNSVSRVVYKRWN